MTGGRPFTDCALCIALLALSMTIAPPAHAQEPAETDAEEDLQRLAEAALLWGLEPDRVVLADDEQRRAALRELDAIDTQHVIGHVIGALSAAAGAGTFPLVISGASGGFPWGGPRYQFLVPGVLLGLAALTGGVTAIVLHVDARDRWRRWDLLLAPTEAGLALRF